MYHWFAFFWKGERTKNIGVVDAEYIVHYGIPTLGESKKNKVRLVSSLLLKWMFAIHWFLCYNCRRSWEMISIIINWKTWTQLTDMYVSFFTNIQCFFFCHISWWTNKLRIYHFHHLQAPTHSKSLDYRIEVSFHKFSHGIYWVLPYI